MVDSRGEISAGDKAADIAKRIVGSWPYIIATQIMFFGWIFLDLGPQAYDPKPWIMLNLILSYMAMVTAPLIMVAQNRQEAIAQETINQIVRMQEHQLHMLQGVKAIIDELAASDQDIARDIDELLERTE